MKVLFAGTAGVRKSTALGSLRAAIQKVFPNERVFTTRSADVPIIEHLLYGANPLTFFKLPQQTQKQRWREAFDEVHGDFQGERSAHHFLGLHLIYRYQQIPICVVDFKKLIDWAPDCIVTFIDDAFRCSRPGA